MREYGVIGDSIVTSATLGEALRSLVRYLPIWTNVGAFSLDIDGPVAHFQWEFSDRSLPEPRHDCEMTLATLARFNDSSVGSHCKPREVWFQHPKPKDTTEHARIFGAPVRFGMPANALLLDKRLLEIPLRTADPNAHSVITKAAEQLLAKTRGEASFSQCVLTFIRRELSRGNFDLEAAARHLGVSRRTLQRRLNAGKLFLSTIGTTGPPGPFAVLARRSSAFRHGNRLRSRVFGAKRVSTRVP